MSLTFSPRVDSNSFFTTEEVKSVKVSVSVQRVKALNVSLAMQYVDAVKVSSTLTRVYNTDPDCTKELDQANKVIAQQVIAQEHLEELHAEQFNRINAMLDDINGGIEV